MKKNLTYGLIVLALVAGVTGCGNENKKENSNSTITMICTGEKDNSTGHESQNIATYHFNKDLYTTDYSITTNQKFNDKDTYEEYKSAQQQTVDNDTEEHVSYSLKSNDKEMTLIFTMTVKDVSQLLNNDASEEEKNAYKASEVLNRYESNGSTCTVEGIDKSKLK